MIKTELDQFISLMTVLTEQLTKKRDITERMILGVSHGKVPLPWQLNSCEVRPSKHGRGVFATKDIKQGDIITYYPAHFYGKVHSHGFLKGHQLDEDSITYIAEYAFDSPNGNHYVGDPKQDTDANFLGHLINDFYPDPVEELEATGKSILKYLLHGTKLRNVEFVEGQYSVAIRAVKDIKKDDELLIAYSPVYWVKHLTSEGMIRIMKDYTKGKSSGQKATIDRIINEFFSGMLVK
jgi:hypothetical protein